jgi:Ran GTPase-activating protein (RanGAP) involved in mRNA processing and transport
MKRLAEALAKNPSLEVLDFNDNNLGKGEAALIFSKTIALLPKLRVLNLGDCMLDAKSASAIIQALCNHTTIEELNLCFSEIGDDVVKLLVDCVVKKSPNLRHLDINGNELHSPGLKVLKETLKALHKENALGSLSDNEGTEEEPGSDLESEPESTDEALKSPPIPGSTASTPQKIGASADIQIEEIIGQVEKLTI